MMTVQSLNIGYQNPERIICLITVHDSMLTLFHWCLRINFMGFLVVSELI